MSEYICKRCNYKTKHFLDIKKHLNKKKLCVIKLSSINYTNDQILILSLLPYNDNKQNIDIKKIENFDNTITKNKDKLFDILQDNNKNKKCPYCNEIFKKNQDARQHIIIDCFIKEIEKNNNKNNIINSYNNNNNNYIIQNITNNIIIDSKNPIPFDEDWITSHIPEIKKQQLIFSKIMYTNLLEEILNNDLNLNVIIDKENDLGLVYKNDIDKYIKMKIKDIIDNSMEKLNRKLNNINNTMYENSTLYEDILKLSKDKIDTKYNDYKNNEIINKNVQNFITNMFENKKKDAINIFNKIEEDNNKIEKIGF